jgi:hypothetical protein
MKKPDECPGKSAPEVMLKVSDYRKHAKECRRLARQSTLPDIREQLLELAKAWDELGEQWLQEIARKRPG